MGKIVAVFCAFVLMFASAACGGVSDRDVDKKTYQDRISIGSEAQCGVGEFFVIDGECVPKEDFLSGDITVGVEKNIVHGLESEMELMNDYVADLSGSKGLGIVSESLYNEQKPTQSAAMSFMSAAKMNDEGTSGKNIIVKLNEDGFFEEVSFTDEGGQRVEVTSNPIALEVFGAFSVVVFEVELEKDEAPGFSEKIWDAYHTGAMYLIHNETGKVFALFDVDTHEESHTYTDYYHETMEVTAEVGVPLTGLFYDEDTEAYEEVPLLDHAGDQIVFEEGPIKTEIVIVEVIEYFEILQYDDDGEPLLGEHGEPVYEIVGEPMLDEDGLVVTYEEEQAVLDEHGEPVRLDTFETTLDVMIEVEVTETTYQVEITETPLSQLGSVFIDRIMADYYNWNFYRVHDYVIEYSSLVYGEDVLYYQLQEGNNGVMERKVMQVTFDDEEEELLVQSFINLTLAQMTECRNLLLDPAENVLVCQPSDHSSNLTIFSLEHGLKTLAGTEDFEATVFPNGMLYYYTWNYDYVEDLGYSTPAFHTITAEGEIISKHVKLGTETIRCDNAEWCRNYLTYDLHDTDGSIIKEGLNMRIDLKIGEYFMESAELEVTGIADMAVERTSCDNEEGCYMRTLYEIHDEDGFLFEFIEGGWYHPGDAPPPVQVVYTLDEDDTIQHRYEHSDTIKYCENTEHGCMDTFYLIDGQIGEEDKWIHLSRLVEAGEPLISRMTVKDDHGGEYLYVMDYESALCEDGPCEFSISHAFYSEGNVLLETVEVSMTFAEGDTVPLRIEYHADEDTEYLGELTCDYEHCRHFTGFEVGEDIHYGYASYIQGEVMPDRITYADDTEVIITEETVERETCLNMEGCPSEDTLYSIKDGGVTVYEMTKRHYPSYGDKVPFEVHLTLDDLEIDYEFEYTEELRLCEKDTCSINFSVYLGEENLGWINNFQIHEGEPLINHIELDPDKTPQSSSFESICLDIHGCQVEAAEAIVLNESGDRINRFDADSYHWAHFTYRAPMPANNDFTITYELTDYTLERKRMEAHVFTNYTRHGKLLDEDHLFVDTDTSPSLNNYVLDISADSTYFKAYSTNLPTYHSIHVFEDGFLGVNADKTAIYYFEFDPAMSDENHMHYTIVNLTEGHPINAVENIETTYDGTIYFDAIDNFIQPIAGTIMPDGEIIMDTTYIDREIIRIRPLN